MPYLLTPLASLAAVTARRLARGPRHAGWTFTYEFLNDTLGRFFVRFSRLSWPEQRKAWAALARPEPVYRRVHLEAASLGGVRGEWIVPLGVGADAPVLVHLHGGGWAHGGGGTHRAMLCRLALATGARVLAPEYRLAPEHPFPAALEDALAVVRALRAAGEPASRIVLSGDSAGGNLAAAALLSLRDSGEAMPAAAVLISPVTDLDARGGSIDANARYDWISPESLVRHADVYLAGHDRADPLASPLRAELAGLPPLLVQVGGAELVLDQSRAFADKARAAGVDATLEVYPGMTHVWHTLAGAISQLQPAFDAIGRFVHRQVERANRERGSGSPETRAPAVPAADVRRDQRR